MTDPGPEILRAEHVRISFRGPGRLFRRDQRVQAVDDVSLSLQVGEVYGLVGESGSGKSTLARGLLRLVRLDAGHVWLDGEDLTTLGGSDLRRRRRLMQVVFQDPYSSLDPSSTIANILAEPLQVHEPGGDRRGNRKRIAELLDQVGLPVDTALRYPYEFSGGQRQRIALARAIATRPKLVVLDEAVSALDVSTQAQILALLRQLRSEYELAYLFISHDLGVVRSIATRVGVMMNGRIVEEGPVDRVFRRPAHPYTQALLAAVPVPDPGAKRDYVARQGDRNAEVAEPFDGGCPYANRCPKVGPDCATMPESVTVRDGGWAACHLLESGSERSGAHVRPSGAVASEGRVR